jgi:hypothetical protein
VNLHSRRPRLAFFSVMCSAAAAFTILFGSFWARPDAFCGWQASPDWQLGRWGSTGVPKELSSAPLIERGRNLARAADCEACHTSKSGVPAPHANNQRFPGDRASAEGSGVRYSWLSGANVRLRVSICSSRTTARGRLALLRTDSRSAPGSIGPGQFPSPRGPMNLRRAAVAVRRSGQSGV